VKTLRRHIPSLTALTAFETAARLSSFTKAATELGVTQAAVSRQIHALEQALSFPLFRREHRKVTLTEKGRILATATRDAFGMIAETVADLRKDGSSQALTISATVAFSHFWLVPRIWDFSRRYPEINLRIVTQDSLPDLHGGDVDLAIRFGTGMWRDLQAETLFEDEVFPVCSPDFAHSAGALAVPGDLVPYPLISNDAEDPMWIGWNEWLSAFSVMVPKRMSGLRCSFYTEAIYAALNGQGIALGWKNLVDDLLRQKRLVRLTDAAITPRGAYFVILPTRQSRNASVDLFLDWLRVAAKQPGLQIPNGQSAQTS
jgi:DNA-binding transcriptional LysR family regulator